MFLFKISDLFFWVDLDYRLALYSDFQGNGHLCFGQKILPNADLYKTIEEDSHSNENGIFYSSVISSVSWIISFEHKLRMETFFNEEVIKRSLGTTRKFYDGGSGTLFVKCTLLGIAQELMKMLKEGGRGGVVMLKIWLRLRKRGHK